MLTRRRFDELHCPKTLQHGSISQAELLGRPFCYDFQNIMYTLLVKSSGFVLSQKVSPLQQREQGHESFESEGNEHGHLNARSLLLEGSRNLGAT